MLLQKTNLKEFNFVYIIEIKHVYKTVFKYLKCFKVLIRNTFEQKF